MAVQASTADPAGQAPGKMRLGRQRMAKLLGLMVSNLHSSTACSWLLAISHSDMSTSIQSTNTTSSFLAGSGGQKRSIPSRKKKSFFRSHGYWLCFLLATMGFIVNGSKRWGNPHDFCPHSMKKWEFDVLVRSASDCTSLNLCWSKFCVISWCFFEICDCIYRILLLVWSHNCEVQKIIIVKMLIKYCPKF